MNNLSCSVTQDLLPLYKDGICSEESRCLVQEHLDTCETCRHLYRIMTEEDPEIILDEQISTFSNDIHFFKEATNRITKRITTKLAILCSLILIAVLLTVYCIVPSLSTVSPDQLSASCIYQLANGDIYLEVESTKAIALWNFNTDYKNISPDSDSEPYFNTELIARTAFFGRGTDSSHQYKTRKLVFAAKEQYQNADQTYTTLNCHKISFTGLFGSEEIFWKEGQELPKAPQEIEDEVAQMRPYDTESTDGTENYYNFDFW